MANLPETPTYDAGIYQIETTDPVLGGPPDLAQGQGVANAAAQQLANRTNWLKAQVDALLNSVASLVPTSRLISTGTGLTGGGSLAANRTLAIDTAEVINEIGAALATLHSAAGFQALPGGLILQWGEFVFETSSNSSSMTVTLPMAFPNSHFQTILSDTQGIISSGSEGARIDSISLSSIDVGSAWGGGIKMPSGSPCRYISIGN